MSPKQQNAKPRGGKVPDELKVRMVRLDEIRPLERNPRRGDVDEIRASIRRHGQYVPLVVRAETDEILKGNHTYAAAREEGLERIAVVYRSVPDDTEAQRLAIGDNRIGDLAGWDDRELLAALQDLPDLDATGYDPQALERLDERVNLDPPDEFGRLDPGSVSTAYRCPSCGYEWSGLPKPHDDGDGEGGEGD